MSEFDHQAWNWDADAAKVERAERVAEAIRVEAGPIAGLRALDYGCGTGLLGFALRAHLAHVTLADTSQGMLTVLREKISAARADNMTPLELDLTTGPGPEGSYDLVCTLMALHHIPDIDGILARFHELLAPGGRLCVADLDAEDGSFHGPRADVHKGFDRQDLSARLLRCGFRNVRFSTPYEILRTTDHRQERFPLFLAVASKG
jgi:ubiquinone/menaquinone biosynthesis C-methylase UbiE